VGGCGGKERHELAGAAKRPGHREAELVPQLVREAITAENAQERHRAIQRGESHGELAPEGDAACVGGEAGQREPDLAEDDAREHEEKCIR
jgi:hypothetical protein